MRPRHPLTIGLAIVVLPPVVRHLLFMGFVPRLFLAVVVALLAGLALGATDDGDSPPPVEYVDCPACRSREVASRDRCRVCGENLNNAT